MWVIAAIIPVTILINPCRRNHLVPRDRSYLQDVLGHFSRSCPSIPLIIIGLRPCAIAGRKAACRLGDGDRLRLDALPGFLDLPGAPPVLRSARLHAAGLGRTR